MESGVKDKKVLWLSLHHPASILNAIGLILSLKDRFVINCLIDKHPYWEGLNIEPLKKYCNQIYCFSEVGFSKHLIREALKLFKIRRELKKLNVRKDDIFLALGNKPFLDNVFMSINKDIKKIKLTSYAEWNDSLDDFKVSHKNFKEIFTSKIWNLTILPFFHLHPIVFMENLDRSFYFLVYKEGDKKIFDKFIFLKDYSEDKLKENEIYNLQNIVRDGLVSNNENCKMDTIVFFGEGRKQIDKYHFDFTNQCLRYIESFFPGYVYLYKSHPFDTDNFEAKNIDLGKFKLYEQKDVAQLMLLNYFDSIKYCFSISSTALEYCIDMGIKSYFFMKLYTNYPQDFSGHILNYINRLGKDIFIKSFDKSPVDYDIKDDNLIKVKREIYKLDYLI